MENRLISMTDKVLELEKDFNFGNIGFQHYTNKTCNYANFLKLPLKLEMFVACDEDGNVLIEPTEHNPIYWSDQYKNACEKVLFEGFEVCNRTSKIDCIVLNQEDHVTLSLLKGKTIEYLVNRNLTLTPNAIKQYNL